MKHVSITLLVGALVVALPACGAAAQPVQPAAQPDVPPATQPVAAARSAVQPVSQPVARTESPRSRYNRQCAENGERWMAHINGH